MPLDHPDGRAVAIVANRLPGKLPDADPPTRQPLEFHRRLPSYDPTPLVDAAQTSKSIGIGQLWVKDESSRFGLPSFKALGASWAAYRALLARLASRPPEWTSVDELARLLAPLRPITLSTATDGNHGRALARIASLLGLGARIFVPADCSPRRIAAIEGEGASVVVVNGSYDDAVLASAASVDDGCLLISDTGWPGYEDIPGWVVDGYSTLFFEIEDELARLGVSPPDVVVVQVGIGSLAAALVRHSANAWPADRLLVTVEPTSAACAFESVRNGVRTTVHGTFDSIMAGLNAGTLSSVAWPYIAGGVDACLAIGDDWTREALSLLALDGINAGASGAASLAGLLALLKEGGSTPATNVLSRETTALVICTEAPTD